VERLGALAGGVDARMLQQQDGVRSPTVGDRLVQPALLVPRGQVVHGPGPDYGRSGLHSGTGHCSQPNSAHTTFPHQTSSTRQDGPNSRVATFRRTSAFWAQRPPAPGSGMTTTDACQ